MEVFFIESAPIGVAEIVWNVQMSLSLNHSIFIPLSPSIYLILTASLSHCLFSPVYYCIFWRTSILILFWRPDVMQCYCSTRSLSDHHLKKSFKKIIKNFEDEKHLIEIGGTALHWYSFSFTITYRLRTTTSCHSFDKIYSH